jgi:major membrane immunogen (membrane-anchored lipoprotein)
MTDRFKGRAAANVAQVDVVAAATSSCAKWKQAVEAALASARVK